MKKNRKSVLSLTLVTAMILSLFSSAMASAATDNSEQANTSAAPSKMQTYVNAMEPGWNLGNSLDAVGEDETAWGNPRITKELIQSIAAEGYNSIRIPVT